MTDWEEDYWAKCVEKDAASAELDQCRRERDAAQKQFEIARDQNEDLQLDLSEARAQVEALRDRVEELEKALGGSGRNIGIIKHPDGLGNAEGCEDAWNLPCPYCNGTGRAKP